MYPLWLRPFSSRKQIATSFKKSLLSLHLHRQNPAQSCLRMSRHGAQDVMARSRVTCHMLSSVTCEVLAGREVAADWGISPPASHHRHQRVIVRSSLVLWNDPSVSQSVFTITERAPTRAFSWLKAPTSAFTFKTLLRHYAKRALTPQSLNVKLGPRHKSPKGRAGWLA